MTPALVFLLLRLVCLNWVIRMTPALVFLLLRLVCLNWVIDMTHSYDSCTSVSTASSGVSQLGH